ncbi:MAG: FMN-binding protein [Phycisphaerales bacterium]
MGKIKYFVQQSWLLIAASFAFGLLIAVANASLEPRIKQNEKDKLDNLMKSLIGQAEDFQMAAEQVEVTGDKGKVEKTDIYKALDGNGKSIGFAFVAVGAGFADKIKLVIAVDGECEKFLGFKVLASNETPGFGSKIAIDTDESDIDFVDQFKGALAGEVELIKTGKIEVIKVIDSQIAAISGATVSSEAVVKIFNTYTGEIKKQLQQKGLIGNGE